MAEPPLPSSPAPLPRPTEPNPFLVGFRAAKANLIPGSLLIVLTVGFVIAYYQFAWVAQQMETLRQLKETYGIFYAMLSGAFFGGVLPWIVQQLRPSQRDTPIWRHLPFYLIFWARAGLEVDLLYRFQSWMFGDAVSVSVIAQKVLVDQLAYVMLWAIPISVLFYRWKDLRYSTTRLRAEIGGRWYRWYTHTVLPVIAANWVFWVPIIAAIYALPLNLQLPVSNMVLSVWVILLLFMVGEQGSGRDEVPGAPKPLGLTAEG